MHARVRGSGRVLRNTESEIAKVSRLMGRPGRSMSVRRLVTTIDSGIARPVKRKVLTMRFFGQIILLSALAISSELVSVAQQSQETASTKGATLVNLKQPIYPPLARQANVYGDVVVTVIVHPDGKTQMELESGHAMLAHAALDSAKQSQFECRGCDVPTSYQLVYSFRLTREGDCCNASVSKQSVKQEIQPTEQNGIGRTLIIISAEAMCLCDPDVEVHLGKKRSRSAKCLYLWACS